MKVNFDSVADVLHIALADRRSDTSEEVAPGIYVELDDMGHVVGLEITSASQRGEAIQPAERAAE